MDVKDYLYTKYEKVKKSKAIKKVKSLTATALIAGSILTSAGLTSCEQKINMSNDELASGIENVLQEQKENFELKNVIFAKYDKKYVMFMFNQDDQSFIPYEISKSQFHKVLEFINQNSENLSIINYNENEIILNSNFLNDEKFVFVTEIVHKVLQSEPLTMEDLYHTPLPNTIQDRKTWWGGCTRDQEAICEYCGEKIIRESPSPEWHLK